MAEPSPTVRQRRLASELRRLREAAGLTGEQAAKQVDWQPSKISRIEHAASRVKATDLTRLLDVYDAPVTLRDALSRLQETSDQRGWWDMYDSLSADYTNYISLEAQAVALRCYEPLVIDGLLQTEEYARAVIRSGMISEQELERRVEVRMTRQEILHRPDPVTLSVVLDEAALRRTIGGPDLMRDQFRHLIAHAELPNVTIQVLPFATGAHPGKEGNFRILKFPGIHDPDVVYIETMASSLYIETDAAVERYSATYELIQDIALNPNQSRMMIDKIIKDL